MALEKWLYGDPFYIVARMQKARTTWRKEAEFCKFRIKPIYDFARIVRITILDACFMFSNVADKVHRFLKNKPPLTRRQVKQRSYKNHFKTKHLKQRKFSKKGKR